MPCTWSARNPGRDFPRLEDPKPRLNISGPFCSHSHCLLERAAPKRGDWAGINLIFQRGLWGEVTRAVERSATPRERQFALQAAFW